METLWNKVFTVKETLRGLLGPGLKAIVLDAMNLSMKIILERAGIDPHMLYQTLSPHLLKAESELPLKVRHELTMSFKELLAQYVFHVLGAHTWFVEKDLMKSMATAQVDDDLRGLAVPYDAMALSFERGTEIAPGIPLRSILIYAPRSVVTRNCITNLLEELPGTIVAESVATLVQEPQLISFYMDFGERSGTGKFDQNTTGIETVMWHWVRRYEPEIIDEKSPKCSFTPEQIELQRKALKIAVACLILYSARPDYVASFTLPRNQRFSWGDAESRRNFKRIILPGVKHVSGHGADIPSGHESGRTVSGHYRGWVYRVLRHERYGRKPDGNFKTTVVPPCVVKGGPAEEDK